MSKWDVRFMSMAQAVARWSKDPSTQVGAVIVDPLRQIQSTGYNGFPRGVHDSAERYADRAQKLLFVVHAEANALLLAGHAARGASMYCTLMPCAPCAGLVAQAGIARLYAPPPSAEHEARWGENFAAARAILAEAGVVLIPCDDAGPILLD